MNNPRYPGYQQSRVAVAGTPALLGQVLGITGVGFLITALAAYIFRDVSQTVGTIAIFVGLAMIFIMNSVRRNPSVALLWFYAFTFVEGVGIAPIISHYTALAGSEVVVNAAATTGFGMLVLGGVSFTFSVDWRRFQGIAFGALIVLVLAGVASMFFHFLNPGVYAWATLGIFTLLTLIDFSRIRAGGDGLTAVDLAVSIYLDGLNIFIALLQLFGMRSRDD
ncbi:MAG TPA: Bax inhibitor-1 family protein [Candidatus Lustribacter sp.]